MSAIEIALPFPPSVNNLFAGKRRRYPTKRYQQWRTHAGWMLRQQKPRYPQGRVDLDIELVAPDRRPRDAGNYEKACTDLLVSMGVLEDDAARCVRGVTARWSDRPGTPGAIIRITELG